MTLSPAPVTELFDEAHLVVRGVITETQVEGSPAPGNALWTRYRLWVYEHLKAPEGPAKKTPPLSEWMEFLQPGGESARYVTRVPGVAPLGLGDEVILLLVDTPRGFQPLGYRLGTFLIGPEGEVQPSWPHHPPQEVIRLLEPHRMPPTPVTPLRRAP